MKTLLLMRHAKSSWDDPTLQDFDRPLNPRGLRDAPRMGQFLKQNAITPDQIVTSTAVRAQTTAKMVAAECKVTDRVTAISDLYHAGIDDWQEMVERESAREDDRIDAVVIATPPQLHFPVARAFLERGIDVICEKPMTKDLAEAEELVSLVR